MYFGVVLPGTGWWESPEVKGWVREEEEGRYRPGESLPNKE